METELEALRAIETKMAAALEKAATREELESLRLMHEQLKAQFDHRPAALHDYGDGDGVSFKSAGARVREFIEKEKEDATAEFRPSKTERLLSMRGELAFPVKRLFPTTHERRLWKSEAKNTITEANITGTPTMLGTLLEGVVPGSRRRLTLRDFLPSEPIDGAGGDFIREGSGSDLNLTSPQVESNDKEQSVINLALANAPVRTMATWIGASSQVLSDLPSLANYINNSLLYAVARLSEAEILSGDGSGSHLNGLTNQATSYAGTFNVGTDTKLDRLRHAILELELADEDCDFIVLSPKDAHDIELIKDEAGGANTGSYVAGSPVGPLVVQLLWGRTLVRTTAMSAGSFLVGNSQACSVLDREQAGIMVSNSHSDWFSKNLIAVRGEERIAFAVKRTSAFIYGSFA